MVLVVGHGVLVDGLENCVGVLEAVSCTHFILIFTSAQQILFNSLPEENAAFLDFDVELLESTLAILQVTSA